ncbi:hypothetical protein Poli38472_014138 [Pythium oligandrum]|uniref:L-2-hydroxyglutarate dehydrogenase, mitochondrial n=1 Tax=Pythium oligandrum TaxID=41045 RepID=A0A8K1FIN5_PYTOL|nr:hypothetical protein Poli38472_014138 [Pythium oligandrum]|eukprot:TMW64021.1 hypothetical protein Poli38472_014138 [Pythium oligandrum]
MGDYSDRLEDQHRHGQELLKMTSVVVAGGGVVGLSIARAMARRGLQVVLLERNKQVGMETSSRNSEVIHAGIYYAKDSWKARLCVQGRHMLYAFCDDYGVDYKRCGKLIVAHEHQADQLLAIASRGKANGVEGLRMVSREEAKAMEPEVECAQALLSPSTGIIDSHGLMLALQGDAEAHGAAVAFASTVESAAYKSDTRSVLVQGHTTSDGGVKEPFEVECDYFINATGMFAPLLQQKCAGATGTSVIAPTITKRFAKGTYFKLNKLRPFRGLVYPIPEPGGLGVHSTVDLEGNVRFGPDVEWIDTIDYTPNQSKDEVFAERIQSYWPAVTKDMLVADYCGIRPKIEMQGVTYDDFYIAGQSTHGMRGQIHLCGIESPGLTSCLAIGETVAQILNEEKARGEHFV